MALGAFSHNVTQEAQKGLLKESGWFPGHADSSMTYPIAEPGNANLTHHTCIFFFKLVPCSYFFSKSQHIFQISWSQKGGKWNAGQALVYAMSIFVYGQMFAWHRYFSLSKRDKRKKKLLTFSLQEKLTEGIHQLRPSLLSYHRHLAFLSLFFFLFKFILCVLV